MLSAIRTTTALHCPSTLTKHKFSEPSVDQRSNKEKMMIPSLRFLSLSLCVLATAAFAVPTKHHASPTATTSTASSVSTAHHPLRLPPRVLATNQPPAILSSISTSVSTILLVHLGWTTRTTCGMGETYSRESSSTSGNATVATQVCSTLERALVCQELL